MQDSDPGVLGYRFGPFEADLQSGELRKSGIRLKLQEKPFQILALLLKKAPNLVTREELFRELWPSDTFVDFDNGLNTAINKLRQALNDPAESARYIETHPRKGYRFVFPVEPILAGESTAPVVREAAVETHAPAPRLPRKPSTPAWRWTAVALTAMALVLSAWLALRSPRSEPASALLPDSRARLVVLPFQDLTIGERKDYLSEGITEEITSQLARLDSSRLGVIARTSAEQYRAAPKPVLEIARELSVNYVLEGSIQRHENSVRIHAQLIRASDQTHFWSETFDRPWDSWLSVQTEVARRVARSLAIELLPGQRAALERASTTNTAAYEAFWQARQHMYQKKDDSLRQAVESFQRAIALDPNYALAYATLSQVYGFLGRPGMPESATWQRRAEEAARKSLDVDPMLAEGHLALARIHLDAWRWNDAEAEMTQALRLNGNDAGARAMHAKFLASIGRYEAAISEMRRVIDLDPKMSSGALGWMYLQAGSYREAQSEAEKMLVRGQNEFDGRWLLGSSLLGQGQVEAAQRELERARKMNDRIAPLMVDLATAYWRAGRRDRAMQIAGALEQNGPHYAFLVATLYATFEQHDRAIEFLERAYEVRAPSLVSLNARREFKPLRNNPRFVRLQQRVGLVSQTQ